LINIKTIWLYSHNPYINLKQLWPLLSQLLHVQEVCILGHSLGLNGLLVPLETWWPAHYKHPKHQLGIFLETHKNFLSVPTFNNICQPLLYHLLQTIGPMHMYMDFVECTLVSYTWGYRYPFLQCCLLWHSQQNYPPMPNKMLSDHHPLPTDPT